MTSSWVVNHPVIFINLDMTTTGDGVISALQVLESMARNSETLSELKSGMTKLPMKMINVRIEQKVNLDDYPDIHQAVEKIEKELGESRAVFC